MYPLDSDTKIPLFGRALRSEVKLDPLELLGKKFKVPHGRRNVGSPPLSSSETNSFTFQHQVNNLLDETHPPRDFHGVVKPAIDDMMGREVTFDILFHNSEHQATLFRYGVKRSDQVS